MTIERMASSEARPPAFRTMCASPSFNPSMDRGLMRASIHVSTSSFFAGVALSWLPVYAAVKRWLLAKSSRSLSISAGDSIAEALARFVARREPRTRYVQETPALRNQLAASAP